MAVQVDFRIAPEDQFTLFDPSTKKNKTVTYFTLLAKIRGSVGGSTVDDVFSPSITNPLDNQLIVYNSQEDQWENRTVGIFNRLIVSGQTDVVASSLTNSLTFVGGTGVTITTNATTDTITINSTTGTVTSVNMSVPTGFDISGNPVTTSGTLALGFDTGYSLPTDATQATWTAAYNETITSAAFDTANGVITLTKRDTNTITVDIDGRFIPLSQRAAANGVATLDGGGKIPTSQLPSSVFLYLGTWNASTNTPTLADGTGTSGDVYRVSVAGTQNLGSGSISFEIGDLCIYDGAVWQKSDSTDAVTSVNGLTGTVVLGVNNIDDVTITSIADNQFLVYDSASSKWKNETVALHTGTGTGGTVAGWQGSGVSSTLGNTPITFAGNVLTTSGDINIGNSASLYLGDSSSATTGKAVFGVGSDLQIYHDGSNSYIDDAGTGDLYIRANNLRLANADGSGQFINANNGGAVEFFHNNSKKFETTSAGVTVTGGILLPNNNDIGWDGGYSAGKPTLAAVGTTIRMFPSGSVSGEQFSLTPTTATFAGNVGLADNKRVTFGADNDLSISHDSTDSYITNTNGDFTISNTGDDLILKSADDFLLYVQGTELAIQAVGDGGVNLRHNNVNKIETTSTGVTVSGTVNTGGGNAAAPSIIFEGNTDTGFFHPATDEIGFSTAGSERMRIKSGGKVQLNSYGSGTHTGTAAYTLQVDSSGNIIEGSGGGSGTVTGTGVATRVAFWSSTSALSSNANLYWDNTNDRLGIGTDVPGAPLEIFGTGNTLRLDSAANGSKEILFRNVGTGTATIKTDGDLKLYAEDANKNILFETNGGEAMRINSSRNVGIGTGSSVDSKLVVKDDSSVVYDASAYQKTFRIEKKNTSGSNQFANIRFSVTGYSGQTTAEASIGVVQTSNVSSGNLVFSTRHNGTRSEKMRIKSDGNVGIGTNNPAAKLEIHSATNSNAFIIKEDTDDTLSFKMEIDSSDNAVYKMYSNGEQAQVQISTAGDSYFNGGDVGIGNTNPTAKLEVSGTVTISHESGSQTSPTTQLLFDNDNIDNGGGYNIDFKSSSNDTANRFMARIQALRGSGAISSLGFFTETGSALTRALLLDSSQNATFSGNVSAPEFDLPSGGMLDWANGDARIIEGLVNNYSLSFQTYDGSGASTALRLDGNNNATFSGEVEVINTNGLITGRSSSSSNTNSSLRFMGGAYTGNKATAILYDGVNGENQLYLGGGTGLGEPATNIRFHTGSAGSTGAGTEKMRISSSGALKLSAYGSGTVTGTPVKALAVDSSGNVIERTLGVNGSGVATRVAFWDGTNSISSSANLYWDNTNNRLGIGTNNPFDRVTVDGDIRLLSGNKLILNRANNGTRSEINTDTTGKIILNSINSEGIAVQNAGSTVLTVTSAGRLGIGTTSPSLQLHIKSTSGDTRGLMIEKTVTNSYAELAVKAAREFRIGTGGSATGANAASAFYVYDATAGGTAGHRFEISSDGDVQARRPRSNTAGDVALSIQPTDSTIHYGFRIDQATNSFNLDRSGTNLQLLRVDTSGNATFAGDVSLADNKKLQLGTSANFNMFFNGSKTTLQNFTGSFDIVQKANDGNIVFTNDDGNGGSFDYFVVDGGSATYSGGATTAAFTKWPDKSRIALGSGKDLQIYHDGTHSYVESISGATGDLYIKSGSDDLVLQSADDIFIYTQGGEDAIIARGNAQVELYYNNSKKIATTSTGVTVTGDITFGDSHFIGDDADDNLLIQGSASENIIIDSADDIILDAGGSDVRLKVAGTEFGRFTKNGNNFHIVAARQDGDIKFFGNDNGSSVTALTLDMSDAGAAEFGARVYIPEYIAHVGDSNTLFGFSGNDTFIVNTSGTTALTIDSSQNATFAGGIGSDGTAKSYTWAVPNTVSNNGHWYKIARVTSAQSARFKLQMVGGHSYSDGIFSSEINAYGQLNNDNNYDLIFYQLEKSGQTGSPVLGFGQVDVDNLSTDLYVKLGTFAELAITASISRGNIYPESTSTSSSTEPTNFIAATEQFSVLSNANFAGDVTITSASAPILRLTNTTGSQSWIQYVGSNDDFIIRDETDARSALIINGSGNSTFSGDVTANGVYTAGNSAPIFWAQRSGGAVASDWSYDDATTDMSLGTSTSHSFSLKTGNTRALTINTSQNATFAGSLDVGNFTFSGSGIVADAGMTLQTGGGSVNAITLASGGNATFAGDIGLGGTGLYTASHSLNIDGTGLAIKNDTNGSSNNWSAIKNTDTGSNSNLVFNSGLGTALTLNHDKTATFKGDITISNATPALTLTDTDNSSNIVFSSAGGGLVVNSASDQAYEVAGSEKMRLTSAGKLGIGTNNPSSLLHLESASSPTLRIVDTTNSATLLVYAQNTNAVIGTYSAHPLLFFTDSNEKMRIGSGGQVMVNHTSERASGFIENPKLSVNGGIYTKFITNFSETGSGPAAIVFGNGTTLGNDQISLIAAARNQVYISTSEVRINKDAFDVDFNVVGDNALSAFFVQSSSGNVGIGTSTPNVALQVNQSASVPLLVHRPNNTSFDPHGIGFSTRSDAVNGGLGDVRSGIFSDYNGDLFLAANTSSITSNPTASSRLFIEGSNGNVAIGTGSPNGKLTISGGGTSTAPTISVINTSSITFNHTINAFTPNLTSGESNILVFGKAGSTKNSAYIGYRYSGTAGSNNNLLILGHWASDNLMTITGGGNVGIGTGTTIPVPKLHLVYSNGSYGTDATSGFINQASTGRSTTRLRSIGDNPSELFFDVNGAARWDISARNSGTSYNLQFYPAASTPAYNSVASHVLELQQNGNVVVTGNGSSGNMGIGNNNPLQKLDVSGNISLGNWTKAGSTYVGLRRLDNGSFGSSGDSGLVIESYNHASPYAGNYSQRVHLRTHLYNGGSHNVLTAYGLNVGIGTSTPAEKLTVSGNANVTSKFAVGITSVHASFDFYNQGTAYFNGATTIDDNLSMNGNINFGSSNGDINMSRGSFITFYEDSNANHSISSRSNTGGEADDIRINSYGAVYVNLDSNSNNTSGADFVIGRHGGGTGTISELCRISGETGSIDVINGAFIGGNAALSRDKLRVWSSSAYAIGMTNGFTFGSIGNSGAEYAMTFQMNDNSNRGFWWGDTSHSGSQGAMSLTTNGKLTVAGSMVVSAGEGNTVGPVFNNQFSLKNYTTVITDTFHTGQSTQAKRYEIARVFFDYNDWGNTGVLEIELMEPYFGQGVSKKYQLVAGYNNYADMDLVEISGGSQTESFQLTVGPLTTVSGDIRYLPIYAEVRFYSQCEAKITTNRDLTTNSLSTTKGAIYINTSPTGTNISDPTIVDNVQTNQGADTINLGTSAKVGIGITNGSTPSYPLHVNSAVSNVSIYASADITAFSDARVKDNIISISDPVEKIKAIRGVTYQRTDLDSEKRFMGVIAQEVLPHVPEVVHEDDKGMYSVSYQNMVALLIEGMKEQQEQIDELKEQVKKLSK